MIRPYHADDRPALIKILRLNTPAYFHPSEEKDFEKYLNEELEQYYVVEENGQVVGCGGINFSDDRKTGIIAWDMFHPEAQGKGWGSRLTNFRIEKLKETPGIHTIRVRTSQLTDKFYSKLGFELKETIKDYWAPGYDMYRMEIAL